MTKKLPSALLPLLQKLGLLKTLPSAEVLASRQGSVLHILGQLGLIDEQEAVRRVAEALEIPFIDLERNQPSRRAEVRRLIDGAGWKICHERRVVPLPGADDTVIAVFADPTDTDARQLLQFALSRPVRAAIAEETKILRFLNELSPSGMPDFDQLAELGPLQYVEILSRPEDEPIDLSSAGAEPIIKLCQKIFYDAVAADASDVHIEPAEHAVDIRFRVDGVLQPYLSIPKRLQPYLLSRLKLLSGMDIAERRRPQDGRLRLNIEGKAIEVRSSTLATPDGEKIALRLLTSGIGSLSLASLGCPPHIEERIRALLEQRGKLLLVTGPTGSGKTTTLYTCLSYLADGKRNIQTIEDPVEYRIPGIQQAQVTAAIGVTFASALRSILRQDPDVIMVGEIRDAETAEIALQAAQTGHLLLSTLHTNDAPSAIARLLNLDLEPFVLASSLAAVLAQRLVRRLCVDCRVPLSAASEQRYRPLLAHYGLSASGLYEAAGCERCLHSGYKGRVGIYSLMRITPEVASLINRQADAEELAEAAARGGFQPLDQAAAELLSQGTTSIEEVAPFLRTERAPSVAAAAPAPAPRDRTEPALTRPRVLLVDDDPDLTRLLVDVFQAEQYEVSTALNGRAALDEMYRSPPQLIICDLDMPEMNGQEFLARVRSRSETREIPVIMLTGNDTEENQVNLLDLGATDFVSKTSSPRVILSRARHALQRRRA